MAAPQPNLSLNPWRRAGRLAATLFFTWHLASLTLPQLTRSNILGTTFNRWFTPYNQLVGGWGTWEMFTTIPYYHTYKASLRAMDAHGKSQDFDAMLPGFAPYGQSLRATMFFMRIVWDQDLNRRYLQEYATKACRALRQEKGFPAANISIQVEGSRLRKLSDIAADGFMGEANNFSKGPIPCASAN